LLLSYGCDFFVLFDNVVTWIEEDWEHNLTHLFPCTLLFVTNYRNLLYISCEI